MTKLKITTLTLLVVVVYVLHQDFWNWKEAHPLVFGFLPIGLAYHAAYSVMASITMAVLVRLVWPKHLESIAPGEKSEKEEGKGH